MDDPFVRDYDASELEIAAEFLTNWLPFLTRDLCNHCSTALRDRVRSLHPVPATTEDPPNPDESPIVPSESSVEPSELTVEPSEWQVEPSGWGTDPEPDKKPSPASPKVRMSWADMAQEDELEEEEEEARKRSLEEGAGEEVKEEGEGKKKVELSREQREKIRFKNVGRKKDFICLERVKGNIVNILDGLELHTGVFSAAEQKRIVDFVYALQERGKNSELGEHTYAEPPKWMRGKGRVTIQFGCCYNYAMDKNGNPPGIRRNVAADPIPNLFKVIIKRLVRWHVLPASCAPDSCIVNIYEPGDCIPPHIDSHDFVRPFCTVSFLTECNILFGSNLQVSGPGEFSGPIAIPLPVGSVLVLNGNGADVSKHCVPAVPSKRISITFRKMDEAKQPFRFRPEPDLQDIQPLPYDLAATESQHPNSNKKLEVDSKNLKHGKKSRGKSMGDAQHHLHDHQKLPVRPRQVIDARSAPSSDVMVARGREQNGRSSESSRFREPQDGRVLYYDGDEPMGSPQKGREVEEGGYSEGSKESAGRRVRLEQKRIIISRNVEAEDEPSPIGSRAYDQSQYSRGRVRTQNNGQRRRWVSVSDD